MVENRHTEAITMDNRKRKWWWFTRSIRGKIVLPYSFITLIVALVGAYVVIGLVAGSLDERLDNHLFDAGRSLLNP